MVTVVSFATDNGEYPKHARRLAHECEALGVPFHVVTIPDRGDWLANCRRKPGFILSCLDNLGTGVLWLDVDSTLLARPTGLRGVDFMGRRKPAGDARMWHVDALYFAPTAAAADLLGQWIDALSDHSDEHAFNRVWARGSWVGAWADLPAAYNGTIVRFRRSTGASKSAALRRLKGRYAPL